MSVIDLFAGPGGWDLAARELGIEPLGIEWDDAACATREAAGLATLQEDVSALDPVAFADGYLGTLGATRLNGLIASAPCQAFSMAGKGEGRKATEFLIEIIRRWTNDPVQREVDSIDLAEVCGDERAHLVLEPLRWATELDPDWIALEQVEPVLPIWQAMAQVFMDRGYYAWSGVLSAEQYGVPQTRRRAFLIARKREFGVVKMPTPTHQRYIAPQIKRHDKQEESLFDGGDRSRIVAPGEKHLLPWVSMAQALGWDDDELVGLPRRADEGDEVEIDGVAYRDRDLRPGSAPAQVVTEKGRSWQRFGAPTHLDSGQSEAAGNQPRPTDEPSPTVTANMGHIHSWTAERPAPTVVTTRRSKDGALIGRQLPEGEGENIGGKNWVDGRPATTVAGDQRIFQPGGHHQPGEQSQNAVRVTQQEAAVLQSFPPDYPWQGSKTKQFEQIGNAVPPLLAEVVLRAVVPS